MNAGDLQAIDHVYEDGAVLVPVPGHPVAGPARLAANQHLQSFGLPIEARPRHAYVAGDIALLIVDRSMRGTARDGTEIDMSGTDVVRRGPDGRWRYVIEAGPVLHEGISMITGRSMTRPGSCSSGSQEVRSLWSGTSAGSSAPGRTPAGAGPVPGAARGRGAGH